MQVKTKKASPEKEDSVVAGGSNPAGVIYIDQDTDITSIASKIRSESSKSVKVVVPKNSTALKSGVNLKLLARTAHSKAKSLSLITSDSKLISMATTAKIATAPNLSAEPALALAKTPAVKVNEEEPDVPEVNQEVDEDLTIDDSGLEDATASAGLEPEKTKKATKSAKASDKKKKIPNFSDFRKKALIGVGVFLALIFVTLLLMTSRRSAVITVDANAQKLDLNFTAELNEMAVQTTKEELKVVKKSGSKSVQESVPATGQQDIGSKASGKLTITNCTDNDVTISAGTGVSSGGLTYLTASSVSVPASDFFSNGTCKNNGKSSVNITAREAGAQYNSGAKSFSISGVPSKVSGQSGQISGGTTQVVKVVAQADVDSLKAKFAEANQDAYKTELKSQFNSSQKSLDDTFKVDLGQPTITPTVGQQSEQVSGSVTVTYSMYGVEQKELEKILELNINSAKESDDQSIIQDGIDELKLSVNEDDPSSFGFSTVAYVGPPLDLEAIKNETAGKKKGEAIQAIKSIEGVNDASVKITPFWASSLPGANKIEVKIEVAEESN